MDNQTITEKQFTIIFPTNINGKLANDSIVHIDRAPKRPLRESELKAYVFKIKTRDGSYPDTTWKLVDLSRMPLYEIISCLTWPSHGLESFEFAKKYLSENPDCDTRQEMAIYYYKKI